MMWCRRAACLLAVLAVLVETQANAIGGQQQWPCNAHAAQNSPEVLQLLRKTGNAFRQVGDILLKKTASESTDSSSAAAAYPSAQVAPSAPAHVYGAYPPQHQYYPYYPMPAYPSAPAVPPMYPVAPPMAYGPPQGLYPVSCGAPAAPHAPPAPPAYHHSQAGLSDQLESLADEYEAAARNECACGCGNVEVNMRQGPAKSSDIVVEVTLGDLTQGQEDKSVSETNTEKKTVNILNVSEASEASKEVEVETAKASSSASLEEKTVEETDESHTIQVVESIKLQPETSPLQVEVFDNTVSAVEQTIKDTVEVKTETEKVKTIETNSGETVINVKTYEESYPKVHEQQMGEYHQNDVIEQSQSVDSQQSQSSHSYEEKVEVVEVKEEKLEELKKEASVVSEIVETVDIEKQEGQHSEQHAEWGSSQSHEQDVKIKVVDVESQHQHGQEQSAQGAQTNTGDAQYFEYEYEYEDEDSAPDCLDKDAAEVKQYFKHSSSEVSKTVIPKYDSHVEKENHLHEGEHVLAEHPHPVENVQVVVQGSSGEAYAEGLHTHTASESSASTKTTITTSSDVSGSDSHGHSHEGVHQHAVHPQPPAPAHHDVPCEAFYGLPKPGARQLPPISTLVRGSSSSYSAPAVHHHQQLHQQQHQQQLHHQQHQQQLHHQQHQQQLHQQLQQDKLQKYYEAHSQSGQAGYAAAVQPHPAAQQASGFRHHADDEMECECEPLPEPHPTASAHFQSHGAAAQGQRHSPATGASSFEGYFEHAGHTGHAAPQQQSRTVATHRTTVTQYESAQPSRSHAHSAHTHSLGQKSVVDHGQAKSHGQQGYGQIQHNYGHVYNNGQTQNYGQKGFDQEEQKFGEAQGHGHTHTNGYAEIHGHSQSYGLNGLDQVQENCDQNGFDQVHQNYGQQDFDQVHQNYGQNDFDEVQQNCDQHDFDHVKQNYGVVKNQGHAHSNGYAPIQGHAQNYGQAKSYSSQQSNVQHHRSFATHEETEAQQQEAAKLLGSVYAKASTHQGVHGGLGGLGGQHQWSAASASHGAAHSAGKASSQTTHHRTLQPFHVETQQSLSASRASNALREPSKGTLAAKKESAAAFKPTQYPPYYFSAHSDSLHAPAIITAAKPSGAVRAAQAFAKPAEARVDMAQIVPQRYASEIDVKPAVPKPAPAARIASASGFHGFVAPAEKHEEAVFEDAAPAAFGSGVAAFGSQRAALLAPAASASAALRLADHLDEDVDEEGPTRFDLNPTASVHSFRMPAAFRADQHVDEAQHDDAGWPARLAKVAGAAGAAGAVEKIQAAHAIEH